MIKHKFIQTPVTDITHITPYGLNVLKGKYVAKSKHIRVDKLGNPIVMKLSFDEWLNIWISSGVIHLMGCKASDYCMSRRDDIGDYEVDNVFINRVLNNSTESHNLITEKDKDINALCIRYGYSRRIVKGLIKRGILAI